MKAKERSERNDSYCIHFVAEVGESPHVGEIHGEADDGEEEVDVGVPGHTIALCVIHYEVYWWERER
jgi:hypothetical protein